MTKTDEQVPAKPTWVWNSTGRGVGLAHLPDCGQLRRLARKAARTGQPVRQLPPLPDVLPVGTPICAHCARVVARADQDYDHAEQVRQDRQAGRLPRRRRRRVGTLTAGLDARRSFTVGQKAAMLARQGHRCADCRRRFDLRPGPRNATPLKAIFHHIQEWAEGGRTELDNGIALCRHCHHWGRHRRRSPWCQTCRRDPKRNRSGAVKPKV
jgi:hypothetical protein